MMHVSLELVCCGCGDFDWTPKLTVTPDSLMTSLGAAAQAMMRAGTSHRACLLLRVLVACVHRS